MSPHRPEPYFCILALPGQPVADLFVLQAADDGAALRQAEGAAAGCPGWLSIEVFQGERLVARLAPSAVAPVLATAA